jgi:hypothetical protein
MRFGRMLLFEGSLVVSSSVRIAGGHADPDRALVQVLEGDWPRVREGAGMFESDERAVCGAHEDAKYTDRDKTPRLDTGQAAAMSTVLVRAPRSSPAHAPVRRPRARRRVR